MSRASTSMLVVVVVKPETEANPVARIAMARTMPTMPKSTEVDEDCVGATLATTVLPWWSL